MRQPSTQEPSFVRTFWDYLTKPSFAKAGLTLLSVVGLGYASQYFEGTEAMVFQGAASFFALMLCIQVTRCCCCCWGSDNTKKNAADADTRSPTEEFKRGYDEGFKAGVNFVSQPQKQTEFKSTYAGQPGMPAVVHIHNAPVSPNSNPIGVPSISYRPPPLPSPTAPLLVGSHSNSELEPGSTQNQTPEGYQQSR
jgi:hypothetical protein